MRILSDSHFMRLLAESAAAGKKSGREEMAAELEGHHQWELRRMEARAIDAESARDRYRVGYKNALKKLGDYRNRLANKSRQLLAAGLDPEGKPDEEGKPARPPADEIFDTVMSEVPGMDDVSQKATRDYIERELRTRGVEKRDQILEEARNGSISDDD